MNFEIPDSNCETFFVSFSVSTSENFDVIKIKASAIMVSAGTTVCNINFVLMDNFLNMWQFLVTFIMSVTAKIAEIIAFYAFER